MNKTTTEDPRLRPTGDCYRDCANLITDPTSDYADWTMVHGRPTLQRAPFVKYGHAWLVKDGVVWDPTAQVLVPEYLYLGVGQVEKGADYFTYDCAAARQRLMAHEHYGPWEGVEAEDLPQPKQAPRRRRRKDRRT